MLLSAGIQEWWLPAGLRSEGTVHAVTQHVCLLLALHSLFPSFNKMPLLQFLVLLFLSLHVAATYLNARVTGKSPMPEVILLVIFLFLLFFFSFLLFFAVAMCENSHI